MGTSSSTQDLLGWDALTCTIVLAISSALIPGIDNLILRALNRRKPRASET